MEASEVARVTRVTSLTSQNQEQDSQGDEMPIKMEDSNSQSSSSSSQQEAPSSDANEDPPPYYHTSTDNIQQQSAQPPPIAEHILMKSEIKSEADDDDENDDYDDDQKPSRLDTSQSDDNDSPISQIKTEDDSQEDEKPPPVELLQATSMPTVSRETRSIGIRIARDVRSLTIKPISNGTLPKSGKPMMSSISPKKNKPRGRPKRKAQPRGQQLPMYQSQISDNKNGIKLCIKKSSSDVVSIPKTKVSRKRSRKSKQKVVTDSEDSDYEKRRRRETIKNRSNNNDKQRKDDNEPIEQSVWGEKLPEEVLYKIFQMVVKEEGALPTLTRLGRVCVQWNQVSMYPQLWRNLDLSARTKDRHRTEPKLKWLIEHRLEGCTDLNLANFKITNIQCVLDMLLEYCPDLTSISLAGWKGLYSDHLTFLVDEFPKLRRLDLSSINVEMTASKSAVGLTSLSNAIQSLNERLTHLHLAHNRLAGIPQIVSTLASHSPNLVHLDLSNVSTIATSHGILHIEKLQIGCPKLKVLLITNSHITLSTATLQEQMDSPGFPELEELSVASTIYESRLINDEYLQRILKTSTKLKLLDVRGCARLTHDSLIRLPTWDLKHLFLSGCSITRDVGSGLELIASKWAHSLTEIDLGWANVQEPLDSALGAFAEKGSESPISHIYLCGSSVSLEAVKELLKKCPSISSINLSSCRGLPRGVKRLSQGISEMTDLKENLGVIEKALPASQLLTPPTTSTTDSPISSPATTSSNQISHSPAGT